MERALPLEKFITGWNQDFPKYPLTAADLIKPHALIGALIQLFDRLEIDRDAVLSVSPEENFNESITYYRDLLPIINMTRVINRLVSVMPQMDATVSVTQFLQPTATMSHSLLLLLFNLMLFNEERLRDIAPYEEELFAKSDQVKALEDKKNKVLGMLNEQAEGKGKRAERMEKLKFELKQFEEELKQEADVHDKEKQELDAITKENHQMDILLEQKKTQRDALIAEVARKKMLRVYDADDIKAQAEQAAQSVQEAEEKLNSLRATLLTKESSLKNLQTAKPSLDTANNLLHEIVKLSECLKDFESGDLDTDSKEGELDVLSTELSELQVQLRELHAARAELDSRRREAGDKRQQEGSAAQNALREEEEKDKKSRERSKKALQRNEDIKQQTLKYEEEKCSGMEEIATIRDTFCNELKSVEDTLIKKMIEMEKRVQEKLRDRNI